MAVRALRGATQVDVDERDAVIEATAELVRAVLDRNGLTDDALISIIFTTTPDLAGGVPGVRGPHDRDHRRAVPVRLGDRRARRDGAGGTADGARRGRLQPGRGPARLPAWGGRAPHRPAPGLRRERERRSRAGCCVVGTGLIGTSVALAATAAGYEVWLADLDAERLSVAVRSVPAQPRDGRS